MKLTIWNRIKICLEILTIRSGHAHTAQEKQLATFQRGYSAGREDVILEQGVEFIVNTEFGGE